MSKEEKKPDILEFQNLEGEPEMAVRFDSEADRKTLDEAAAKGVKISDIFSQHPRFDMSIITSEGDIFLHRMGEGRSLWVSDSTDPSLQPDDVIVLDGATLSGGSAQKDILAPGVSLAFRKQVVQEYTVGDEDTETTLTPNTIEKYTTNQPEVFKKQTWA